MDSRETNTNKSNLPGRPSSPKRQKIEKANQITHDGQQSPITIGNQPNGSSAPSQILPGITLSNRITHNGQQSPVAIGNQSNRSSAPSQFLSGMTKPNQITHYGQQSPVTIANQPNRSNAPSQFLPGTTSPNQIMHNGQQTPLAIVNQPHRSNAPSQFVPGITSRNQITHNGQQSPVAIANQPNRSNAPSQFLSGTTSPNQITHNGQQSPAAIANQPNRSNAPSQFSYMNPNQILPGSGATPMSPLSVQAKLLRQLWMEKVKQTMQNGQQIPITTGNQANTSNPPSRFLPGLGATPVSPVNYVLRDQLLRRSLRQQQRLTNGAPMVPKCSMQQTSKALDTKDNNAPIPADPVSSQAELGDESIKRKEVLLGIPRMFLFSDSQVVEDANRKAPTSAISPSTAAPIKDIVSGILDGRGILITFGNFPYYLCDRTKHALVASFFLHMKHKEYARCNADARRFRIIFSGPTGSRIYQEKLAMALAHHVGAKLLVLGNSFFPADMSTMGIGPSRDVLWTHFRHRATQSLANPSHSEMNNHFFKKGDRVVFVGSNSGGLRLMDSPRGPTFGSLGEIVSTSQVSYLSKFGVRFDNPIHGGLDLGGQCKAGYGFNCNANELCLDPTTLKDFNKSITNNYLEAIMCASRDSPLILFVKDVDKFVQESSEAYLVMKYLINKLPANVFVIGSQTDTENNKEKESFFGKYEKDRKLTEMAKLLSNLFPNQIPIEMPEDEKHIAVLKRKFSEDSELIIAKENITCLQNVLIRSGLDSEELEELSIVHQTLTYESAEKVVKWALGYQLMEYPQSNENPNLVLSLESVEYGVNVLRETQPELKTSEKLLKDVVTENGFEKILLGEVIPPNEAGVKFDDIGALENVKDTLKELVMLPLQRPELFCKGQLRKPCKGILLFGPPGTGKTMLAKAIATEAGANFINISVSTIASKWYGDAEKYVRAVFSLAIKISPSIIFVDEVDSLLGHRGNHEHELTRRIKNEFMLNWDGLRTKDGERVLVLAATNRPFDLDEAVIRRMPRRFMVNLPDAPNRTKILQVILEKEELSPDVDFDVISGMTDGYSGSDLKNLCVTAAYCPIREILKSEKQKIAATVPDMEPMPALNKTSEIRPTSMEDFKYAREQISASFSTESMNMNELLKWNELYGEGGSRRKTTLSYFL